MFSDFDVWDQTFADLSHPHFEEMAEQAVADALAEVPSDISAALVLVALAGFLLSHARSVGEAVNRVTQADLSGIVRESVAQGDGISELSQKIREAYAGYSEVRATRIARTETASVYNTSTIETYRQTGEVQAVQVIDGTNNDQACAQANGQRWSLEWAESHPWQHPNCRRSFTAILRD